VVDKYAKYLEAATDIFKNQNGAFNKAKRDEDKASKPKPFVAGGV
jgi:hypothetical protein